MTDLDGLPQEFRYSMWLLRQASRFGCRPSQIEDEDQALIGHLEREQMLADALKRYS